MGREGPVTYRELGAETWEIMGGRWIYSLIELETANQKHTSSGEEYYNLSPNHRVRQVKIINS